MAQPKTTISRTAYLLVYVALLVLLGATVGVSFLNLGRLTLVVTISIATAKAILVVLYFMHVRQSSKLTWVFVASGYVWLGILLVLGMSDYITRGSLPVPGQ